MRKHWQVREGQIVRVIDGPLTGFRGEVKEVNKQTAKVAVQVFGRLTPTCWRFSTHRISQSSLR
jgi:transcription antitermination factor NusG